MKTQTTLDKGQPDGGASDPIMRIRGLGHSYGERRVLEGLDFEVGRGELMCVVGPSGVGKTTLLECLTGLRRPGEGEVVFDGQRIDAPPRGLAIVFQDYSRSLMPWLSVLGNVVLPLRSAGLAKAERERTALEALAEVGLSDFTGHYPWQLSGGMQQRVAIARALAYRPAVVVMDEPFASVDAQTRADLEDLLLRVREHLGITVLLVTHDIDEAVYLSDRVLALGGKPAGIRELLTVDLPAPREQVSTKALPRFAELRSQVYRLIRDV
ncbi:ABC transporter ATP-binding protein [Streptomyces prasinopilosus]|uniref:NitT/TauT family transport system ATP-binding protein n=2 Tax=Streptomyces prasinopilosus TaxID=67344 RepID=A0A1G6LVU9_9ACTN|nr:ABC transporter ATP-binding protein [Streptomyces prasinopilosus]SDC46855.1 NitT/TauT family transport system ATP-binding protein [Streptomyces prasinopilosus]